MLTEKPADYIFFTGKGEVRSLVRPHRMEDFGVGLPRRGVCASDHVSLACDLFFPDA
jgi:RNA exonuclease NGL2